MRRWREVLDTFFALAGVGLILVPAFVMAESMLPFALIFVGVLMVEAGVWGLGGRLAPESRTYVELREETERFLEGVRELNRCAVEGDVEGLEAARTDLHDRVDRMSEVAGS